jgi:opacity protein-like surface antigen
LVVTLLTLVGTDVAGGANVTVGHDVGDGVLDAVGLRVGVAGIKVGVGNVETCGNCIGDWVGCGVDPHATTTNDSPIKTTRCFTD